MKFPSPMCPLLLLNSVGVATLFLFSAALLFSSPPQAFSSSHAPCSCALSCCWGSCIQSCTPHTHSSCQSPCVEHPRGSLCLSAGRSCGYTSGTHTTHFSFWTPKFCVTLSSFHCAHLGKWRVVCNLHVRNPVRYIQSTEVTFEKRPWKWTNVTRHSSSAWSWIKERYE